jgi:DNA adenine methylase
VRIAKQLTTFLKSVRKPGQTYVEPCVGGASIIRLMEDERIASDIDADLIECYRALQQGWLPPTSVTEEDYKYYKKINQEGICSAKIGFIKFFCSFGGKCWGGLARDPKSGYDFINGARNTCLKFKPDLQSVKFYCCDYEEFLKQISPGCLIYVDPPYQGTTEYKNKFDHTRFWQVMREFSDKHDIYISEYQAPEDFGCVWQIERKTCLNMADGGKADRTEKLFKYKGKLDGQIVM